MKKLLFVLFVCAFIPAFALQNLFMKHIMVKGETIYSLSKEFGVSIDNIKNVNPGLDITNVKIGNTINIPLQEKVASSTLSSSTKKEVLSEKYHSVKVGESLYSIAKLYHVTIAELETWNSLPNQSIKIDQKLLIKGAVMSSTKAPNTAKPPVVVSPIDEDVTDPTTRNSNTSTTNTPKVNSTTYSTASSATSKVNTSSSSDYNTSQTVATGKREKGIGMSMIDASDNPTNIALYSGASIGSMISVKNLMNGKTIQAKVVGKIPNLDRNKDVLVKISAGAYESLGALDEKFLVEVEY